MTIKTVFENRKPKPEGVFEALVKRFMEKRLKRLAEKYGSAEHKMAVFAHDFVGTSINLFGRLERDEIEDLFLFLAPVMGQIAQGTALDIGANIGNHTLVFAERFARVQAFEPNPDVFSILTFNCRSAPNVHLNNFGLGEARREARMVEGVGNLGTSRVLGETEGADGLSIRLETLDRTFENATDDITFIKIDVEGYEENVIRGGLAMLRRCRPLIVLEQHRSEFAGGTTPSLELLRSLGYTLCWSEYPRERARLSIVREAMKIADRAARRRPRIVTGDAVTVKSHSMLIAVPERFRAALLE